MARMDQDRKVTEYNKRSTVADIRGKCIKALKLEAIGNPAMANSMAALAGGILKELQREAATESIPAPDLSKIQFVAPLPVLKDEAEKMTKKALIAKLFPTKGEA